LKVMFVEVWVMISSDEIFFFQGVMLKEQGFFIATTLCTTAHYPKSFNLSSLR
jgi:hypothetical protein